MDYQIPIRTARIVFDAGSDHYGAEIVMRRNIPLGIFFDILAEDDWQKLIAVLLPYFIEWNLQDEDGPIPVTTEGFKRVPKDLFNAVFAAWMDEVRSPTAPLAVAVNGATPASPGKSPKRK